MSAHAPDPSKGLIGQTGRRPGYNLYNYNDKEAGPIASCLYILTFIFILVILTAPSCFRSPPSPPPAPLTDAQKIDKAERERDAALLLWLSRLF